MKMTMTLFPQPLSFLTARSLHPRTPRTQAPPRAKRERERGGQLHVSAHFTAQAFSLNKMLSGGEKGRRTKGLAKGEQEGMGRARERATDKLPAKQSRSRVVKLYLQHKQSCRQGSSDADANDNDEGKGEGEREEQKEKAKDKHEAEHNDKHEADETDTHRQTYRVRQTQTQTRAHTYTVYLALLRLLKGRCCCCC